jgi:hypothetical protein
MEYFKEETKTNKEFPEEVETLPEESIPELSANEPDVSNKDVSNEIEAETLEIPFTSNDIRNKLQAQNSKFWRFHLKNGNEQLTKVLQDIPNYSLTAEYNIKQDTPDITLKQNDEILGKINLLLCDRRDRNNQDKHYCRIYLYHFKDRELFTAVKNKLLAFFNALKANNTNLKPHNNSNVNKRPNITGGYIKSKGRRTQKKRRVLKRKKTQKRK